MNDIIKTIKSLEEHRLLIKRVSETIKNEAKEQKGGLLGLLLGILEDSLGKDTIIAGKSTIRLSQNFQCNLII